MSIEFVAQEILRFLQSSKPEVMCITGKWGVGKTYAWNQYLKQARDGSQIALARYAYVSLFGRNSIDDLRASIVENTVDKKNAGDMPDLTNIKSITSQIKGVGLGWFANLTSNFPGLYSYTVGINRVLYLLSREQIVCIDDLERAGSGLGAKMILGLVSSLKEEKRCKVVILLNDEMLAEEDKKDFKAQLEKVADVIMRFDPTAAEAAEIGIDKSNRFHGYLSDRTRALGIKNIRVIKKAENLCQKVCDILPAIENRILESAVNTIVLAAYSKFVPETAPPLDFIKTYNSMADAVRRHAGRAQDENQAYRDQLRAYGFNQSDEFDIVLIDGVERGYFDTAALEQKAGDMAKILMKKDKDRSFSEAWDLFHGSFDNDEDQVLDAIAEAFRLNAEIVTPINLSGTLSILKEFGRTAQAQELLDIYIDCHSDMGVGFWDISQSPLGGHVTDVDVRSAFLKKAQSLIGAAPNPAEILIKIKEGGGWSAEDMSSLAGMSKDEYVAVFKRLRDDALRKAIYGALFFKNVSNADANMLRITRTAQDALRQIAAENPFNAKRVTAFAGDLTITAAPLEPAEDLSD